MDIRAFPGLCWKTHVLDGASKIAEIRNCSESGEGFAPFEFIDGNRIGAKPKAEFGTPAALCEPNGCDQQHHLPTADGGIITNLVSVTEAANAA